jgi:hypothetical protein
MEEFDDLFAQGFVRDAKAPIGELRSLESAPSVRKTWSFRFERGDMLVAPTPSV